VDDVAAFCAGLEAAGVRFQKRLSDGRMRHIAFALDPDGYWVEILPRTTDAGKLAAAPRQPAGWPALTGQQPSLQQVMYRIRDPAASLPFYTRHLGMTLVCERHYDDFSLFFLGTPPAGSALPGDPKSDAAWDWIAGSSGAFLELTWNHGTEADPGFKGYHNGNTEPGRCVTVVGRGGGGMAALAAPPINTARPPLALLPFHPPYFPHFCATAGLGTLAS
jgi:lactoylglutathione lyase